MNSRTETERLDISEETREQFDEMRTQSTPEHLPDPSDELFLTCLMDTYRAVNEGYYSQGLEEPKPGVKEYQEVMRR